MNFQCTMDQALPLCYPKTKHKFQTFSQLASRFLAGKQLIPQDDQGWEIFVLKTSGAVSCYSQACWEKTPEIN